MNTVKSVAVQADAYAPAQGAKGQKQNSGDFLEILSGAMAAGQTKNADTTAETTLTAEGAYGSPCEEESGLLFMLPEDGGMDMGVVPFETPDENPDDALLASMAAQMHAPIPAFVQDNSFETAQEDIPKTDGAAPVQAEPRAPQAEHVQAARDTKATEQAATVQQQAEQNPAHTRAENSRNRPMQVNANRPERAGHEQAAVQNRAQGEALVKQPLQGKAEVEAVSVEAGATAKPADASAGTVEITGGGMSQAKFDGMLAKAQQELDKVKTGTVSEQMAAEPVVDTEVQEQEAPEAPKTQVTQETAKQPDADIPEDLAQEEPAAQKPAETVQPQEKQAAEKSVAVKRESWQMESVRTHVPEIREQKPAKVTRRDEETAANAVQPKTQQVATREPVNIQRQEPAATAKTPDQFEQIRAQVIRNLEDQKTEFKMQLNPQELGKVDVKMILEGGKLAIEIIAANAKSAEILNKQTEALLSSLRMNNLEVTTVNVVTAGQNASGQMNGEYNLNNFGGNTGRQDSQGSNASSGKNAGDETPQRQEGEQAEEQPRGILNYSI